MQKIKHQILSQLCNNEAKRYIQKHIFGDEAIKRQANAFVGNLDSMIKVNNSSIFSSYLQSTNQIPQKMPIKFLLGRIQKLIVTNGLYRTAEEIKQIRSKTAQLQEQNGKLSAKLNSVKKAPSAINNHLSDKKNADEISPLPISSLNEILSLKQQIVQARQKNQRQRVRENIISLVKLSDLEKLKLLEKTRNEFELLKSQTERLERVIQNVEKTHPDEAWLAVEVEQLQKELDEKTMLLGHDSKLTNEIEIMQAKVQLLENKKNYHKKKANQIQETHQNFIQQKNSLMAELQSLQQFIKSQNEQKKLLVNDIRQFNVKFEKEKGLRGDLLKKIKDNFYKCPEMIDGLIKAKQSSQSDVDFIFKELQIQLD